MRSGLFHLVGVGALTLDQSDGYAWWALQESNLRPRACEADRGLDSHGLVRNLLGHLDSEGLTQSQKD